MGRKVMKDALMAASRAGDIDALYNILKKVPEILENINKVQFVHTPLHAAVEAGQTYFAIELMNLMPSFARKLNPQGLSPLHLAVGCTSETVQDGEKRKRNETAKALVEFDHELIRVKGRERITPLHYAVIKKNVDLLADFLRVCPGSIDDLTNKFQSAVHIAVKEAKIDALDVLLGWLSRRNREDVLDFKDDKGDTALHIAVETEQIEVVKKLIHKVKRNSFNANKLTASDIAKEKKNTEIQKILRREGGRTADKIFLELETLPKFLKSKEGFPERVLRLLMYMGKEMSLDMRNIVLVVAVLIVTATFQGVLQPPGGFWQGNAAQTSQTIPRMDPVKIRDIHNIRKQHADKQSAGKVVMGSHNFNTFIIGNTIAFVFAAMVIFTVLPGRPYLLGLHASMMFLTFSYLKGIQIIAEHSNTTQSLIIITWLVISIAFAARIQYFIAKALFYDAWWLPRLSMLATNSLYQIPLKKWVACIVQFNYRLKLQHRVSSL